jgi:hypothetical protein
MPLRCHSAAAHLPSCCFFSVFQLPIISCSWVSFSSCSLTKLLFFIVSAACSKLLLSCHSAAALLLIVSAACCYLLLYKAASWTFCKLLLSCHLAAALLLIVSELPISSCSFSDCLSAAYCKLLLSVIT